MQDAQAMGGLLNLIGVAPAYRAAVAAREGRPLAALGNAGAAMMPFRPLAGAGTLATAYGGAIARDLGAFNPTTATAATLPGLTPEQQRVHDEAQRKIERRSFNSGAERRQLEKTMEELRGISRDFVIERNRATIGGETKQRDQEREEYGRSVRNAESARNTELARERRFSETNTGRLFEETGGLAPMAMSMPFGMLSRAASGGGSRVKDYLMPALAGGGAGITAANVPLAYDSLYTEAENPQRRAYEAYARELPPTHPRRQEWMDYARSLPEENPIRREASRQLYDPMLLAKRTGLGAVEGVLGGLGGAELWRTPSRLSGMLRGRQSPPPTQGPPPSEPTPLLGGPAPQAQLPPPAGGSSPGGLSDVLRSFGVTPANLNQRHRSHEQPRLGGDGPHRSRWTRRDDPDKE